MEPLRACAGLRAALSEEERQRLLQMGADLEAVNFRGIGALTHSRCGHSLSCTDEACLGQINLGAAVHLPLDEFELGDLAFGLAIRPREIMALRTAAMSFSTPFAKEPTRLAFAPSSQASSFATAFDRIIC